MTDIEGMDIRDIDQHMIEYGVDDILFPFIKKQLKLLLFINIIVSGVSFYKLMHFNTVFIVIFFGIISGLLIFSKLLSILTLRNISKIYFFGGIFPLYVTIPFEFFCLKKDQTAMVYIGWLWWIILCIFYVNKFNYIFSFFFNLILMYAGIACTFFLVLHLYYFFLFRNQ